MECLGLGLSDIFDASGHVPVPDRPKKVYTYMKRHRQSILGLVTQSYEAVFLVLE